MTYCTLEIQAKKIKVEDDDTTQDNQQQQEACYDFWNEAPEDVLTEIFIRHPDSRSALRTTTVCRRWRSLISRNPNFIQRFKSHHRLHHHRYSPDFLPWTIMFRLTDFYKHPLPGPHHFQTICQLYSDEFNFLHGKSSLPYDCLSFLPSPMVIKASCNDLLLVSPGSRCNDDHYICNPITKQFSRLPPNPRPEDPTIYEGDAIGFALLCEADRFKVVEVLPSTYDCPGSLDLNLESVRVVPVTVFCSESRKWKIRNIPFYGPPTKWCIDTYSSDVVSCNNGILYWLGFSRQCESVVYLDLAKERSGAFNIPFGDEVFEHRIGLVRVSGGAHELRLMQVLRMDTTKIFHLRVWRLNTNHSHDEDDWNWFLVHDKMLGRPKNLRDVLPLVVPFVHPTDGDSVFVVWGKTVVEYNLVSGKCKKIAKLREIVNWSDVRGFSMVLPSSPSILANDYL